MIFIVGVSRPERVIRPPAGSVGVWFKAKLRFEHRRSLGVFGDRNHFPAHGGPFQFENPDFGQDIADAALLEVTPEGSFRAGSGEVNVGFPLDDHAVHRHQFVAALPGFEKVVGVGEYLLDRAANMAEVAFSVSRPYQAKGLGTMLINKLAGAARENGIAGVLAYTSPQNQGMIKLFNALPYEIVTRFDGDMLELSCRFDRPKARERSP